jgi:glutathione-specific gamma-glutamylcyclotransferase
MEQTAPTASVTSDIAAVAPDAHPRARDPAAMLARLRAQWGGRTDLWVFGYASLIWRPEFEAAEHRSALVHGWHRALRMRSRINRGTPQQPGLVFALLPGGACRGEVYRLPRQCADAELERLWAREMPTGVYDPRWLPCRTAHGVVPALAFTLSRRSDACLPRLHDAEHMLHILRHARGRYGTTLDYLAGTAQALRERGVRDREIERLMRLAACHGLL